MNSKLSDQVFLPLSARFARKLLPTARNSGTAAVIRGLEEPPEPRRGGETRHGSCILTTVFRRRFRAGISELAQQTGGGLRRATGPSPCFTPFEPQYLVTG